MPHKQPLKIALTLSLSICPAWQTCQAADYVSESDYYQEFPVVLSASRLSQPLSEAPNAMTVIDRKMIVASGFRTLPDLFKRVPGMYVSYYKGSQAIVSYHGSNDQYARRMQVMIDGRSVYMPPTSTVDWANLPITLDDIERIEVIRGPAAASHGANSTQGVISIITRDAGAADGKRISITRGNKGVNDVAAHFGQRGETLDYRVTLGYSADNGYDNLTTTPNNLPPNPGLLNNSNDSNQSRLMNFRADYHPNALDRFDIQFGLNQNVQTVGWTDSFGDPVHDLTSNAGFMQLAWIRQLDDQSEFSLRYAHMGQNQHESFPILLLGGGPISQSVNIRRDEIELQHTRFLTASNRLVYGAAYRTDSVSAQGNIPPLALAYASDIRRDEYRLFAHDEWRITPNVLLNTGAMLERNALKQQNISPRATLNFHLTPQHTLRIGTSVAYRTPALAESRLPVLQPGVLFVPNAMPTSLGLMPEKLVSREIGYLAEFPDAATSLDVRLYSDLLSDGIFYDKTYTKSFVNGMSGEYRGIEATLKHDFNQDSQVTLNFSHALASSNGLAMLAAGYTGFRSSSQWNADILGASTPRNSGSLLYTQGLPHDFAFNAAYYHQDAMQPFDRGPTDYQPIQRRVDMRLAKTFSQGGIKGDLALVVQNVFNRPYTEYVVNNVFNRRAHVTLSLDW